MADSHNHDHDHAHDHGHVHGGQDDLARIQGELTRLFAGMPHSVPLYLFSDEKQNPQFSKAAREVLELVSSISPKVTFQE